MALRRFPICLSLSLSLVLAFLLPLALCAQTVGNGPRYALVIGNGAYVELARLKNPTNDATDMARALRELGFAVNSRTDVDLRTLRTVLDDFAQTMQGAQTALFYYSGHRVAYNGGNYLVPVSADVQVGMEEMASLQPLCSKILPSPHL